MTRPRASRSTRTQRRFSCESLEPREVLAVGPLIISEFLAANTGDNPTPSSNLADADGAWSDWIEIQNISASPVDLAGWHLTDNAADLDQWTFPSRIVNPGQFLIVFASNKDRTGAELHTNFKLNADGDYLALVKPDLSIAHEFSPEFPEQDDDISYGVTTATTTTTLVVPSQIGAVHVPVDASLGTAWIDDAFDASGWTSGPLVVGYDTAEPGPGATVDYALVDIGPAGQRLEAGWTGVGIAANNATASMPATSYLSSTGDIFSVALSSVNWIDRGDSTSSDALVRMAEDHVRATNTIVMTLSSLPAGTYQLTSYHVDAIGSQAESIRYLVTDAVGNGVVQPTTGDASYPGHPNNTGAPGVNGLTTSGIDAKARTITVVSDGTAPIVVTYDSSLSPLDKELPLSGFKLRHVQPAQSYGDLITTDVESVMLDEGSSVYVRAPFELSGTPDFDTLRLKVRYDDGFIAYLNGTVVASRNAPGSPVWSSVATQPHPYAQARVEEVIDISAFLGHLQMGTNVLSLHGLNTSANDSDFLLSPTLEASKTGDQQRYFGTPTPGAANNAGYIDQVADTEFRSASLNFKGAGFYDAPFTVQLSTDTPGAEIRYTTNGTAPTASTGSIYNGTPINITTTTTLRAAAFKPGYESTNVDTQTYIFLNDVIHQPNNPAGYPSTWGVYWTNPTTPSPVAYYQMDQEIVNDPAYSSRIVNDLKAIPTMSIVMNPDDLFKNTNSPAGTGGIYSFSKSQDADGANPQIWERPGSVELIYPDGTREGFQIDAGIQVQGGASREPEKSVKHSFRLLFKERYGASKLNFPFFEDSDVDEFDAIVLKAGFNNTWMHWDQTQRLHGQYLQDQWASETQLAMGQPGKHSNYVHLYLNGMYWGLYSPMERPESTFMSKHIGGEPEDWDVINNEVAIVDGNLSAWNAMFALANAGLVNNSQYDQIKQYLDVENFIDYMIVNFYGGNRDWDDHNWYASRRSRAGGVAVNNTTGNPDFGFKFFTFDAERILESTADNVIGTNLANRPSAMFQALRNNAEFRLLFADRVHKHFFNDGALTSSAAAARYAELAGQIDEAISGEAARWGDYRRDDPIKHAPVTGTIQTYDRPEWNAERDRILNTYFPARTPAMVHPTTGNGQFKSANLYPNVNAPEFNQHGGRITPGFDLSITGPAGSTIYYTLDGTDPRLVGGAVSGTAQVWSGGTIDLNDTVRVKARALAAGVWSALTDATFALDASALRVTEIMYNPAPPTGGSFTADDYEFIELQNTSAAPLDVQGVQLSGSANFDFPNLTLSAGQRVVLAKNMAAFLERYPGVTPVGIYSGELENDGDIVRLEDAIGVEIVEFRYQDDWYPITDGEGFSLVAINPAGAPASFSLKSSWRPSQFFSGNPGAGDGGVNPGSVVINEILANTTDGVYEDQIELLNPTGAPIMIGGWYLSDDPAFPAKFRIPAGTVLGADDYIVFNEVDHFGNSGNPDALIPFDLSRFGGQVLLSSPDPVAVIGGYREDADFGASEAEVSLGRYIKSDGSSDFVPLSFQTFQEDNSYPKMSPLVISEVMYHPVLGGHEYIELTNVSGTQLWYDDPSNPGNTWRLTDGVEFTFPTGLGLEPGQKALVVPIAPATFRTLYSVPADVQVLGPYTGSLDNNGERIALSKPGVPQGALLPYIEADFVNYGDQLPWPVNADGQGYSLNRTSDYEYANDFVNWQTGVNGGTPGFADSLRTGTLAGRSFSDNDGDGIQDVGESGQLGTTVNLYYVRNNGSVGGTTNILVDTKVTAASGDFTFTGVGLGEYYIQVVPPSVETFSPPNVGGDDTVDSDVDQVTGRSHVFFLEGNTTITNVDVGTIGGAAVVGRHIFYNQSRYDGASQGANPLDDGAIAPDKIALRPGQTASFVNYTSYSRGINGIMIDVVNLPFAGQPAGMLTAGDFAFKVGNSNTPSAWATGPGPSAITVRPGAGVGGSDRITLLWPSGAIIKQWLQITVNATSITGLIAPDVFYFGNAIAESANSQFDARVTVSDEVAARNNPYSAAAEGSPAPMTNRWDYNRDGNVSAQDQVLARNNQTTVVAALRLITVPALLQPGGLVAQPLVLPADDGGSSETTVVTQASTQSAVAEGGRIGRLMKSSLAAADLRFAAVDNHNALPERNELTAADVDDTLIGLLATDRRARAR